MECLIQDAKYSLLIDSGASLSVLKYETVKQWNIPMHTECISINGIGGKVQTVGYVFIALNLNGNEFIHKFYVMKFLPCIQQGIIGRDFMRKYKAI